MREKTNAQLTEENVAFRILLEEARKFGAHAWSCATVLKTSDSCDCWYGKAVETLIEPPKLGVLKLTVALEDIECRCGHKADMHSGHLVGSAAAVCTACGCPCMAFAPKEMLS